MTTINSSIVSTRTRPQLERAVRLMLVLSIVALPSCLSFGSSDDKAATDKEAAEMAKLYRLCLQKNEGTPAKAKEKCAMYKEAPSRSRTGP